MSESLLNCLGNMLDILPSCEHYRELLNLMALYTDLGHGTLREKYGTYTYKQWGPVIIAAYRNYCEN